MTVSLKKRFTWEQLTEQIQRVCDQYGIEWHELRAQVVGVYLVDCPWPEDEGLGSSDMNHILVGEWQSHPAGVHRAAADVKLRKEMLASLARQGVTLEQLRGLLAPA